jgi:hypothetical protein
MKKKLIYDLLHNKLIKYDILAVFIDISPYLRWYALVMVTDNEELMLFRSDCTSQKNGIKPSNYTLSTVRYDISRIIVTMS